MKKFPTALTVPSSTFRVWLTMAPPPEAMAPALGRLCGTGAAGVTDVSWVDEAAGAPILPSSR